MSPYFLGINTVTQHIGISIQENGQLLRSIQLGQSKASLENLIDSIREILGQTSLSFSDLSAIAVCNGPGGYTGIRCGLMVAKTIAQFHQIPVYPLNALSAIVKPFESIAGIYWALLPSKRDECHLACFGGSSSGLRRFTDDMSIPLPQIIHLFKQIESPVTLLCNLNDSLYESLAQAIPPHHPILQRILDPWDVSNFARTQFLDNQPGLLKDCQAAYSHPVS